MKRFAVIFAAAALALAGAPSAGSLPSGAAVGFENPESVVWDAATGAWYITNFGQSAFGFGDAGSGFVAKLEPGALTPEIFADGLDGPQGIDVHEGVMYVADLDKIRMFDMDDPSQQTAITVPDASLNDLHVDRATGDLYITELGANRVWRLRDGVAAVFGEINSPDGIYVHDGGVFIANFALGGPGGVFRLDIATGDQTTVAEIPGAFLDGLQLVGDDWYVTDFVRGQLMKVTADGTVTVEGQLVPSSADIGYDPDTATIGIPLLAANTTVFWQV